MGSMFNECSSLNSLPDISNWNTTNVTNMRSMFN
ncbi:MAG: BspA family leucine-rich repeat surface protein, partial [Methanobrevibacter sp.]|nr:BspA family leucine-rich repeat surface protein [Methanobrevibacter sp.]